MRVKLAIRAKVFAGFLVALAALIAMGASSYSSVEASFNDNQWVEHTHEVIDELGSTLLAIQSAESSARGYIVTGNESGLQLYHDSTGQLQVHLAQVKTLVEDNSVQQDALAVLSSDIDDRLQTLDTLIGVRRIRGFEAAQSLAATGKGSEQMQKIRDVVAGMEAREQTLLEERSARLSSTLATIRLNFSILTGVSLVIFGLLFGTVTRDLSSRKRTETALRASEERSRTLLSSLPQRVFFKDKDLKFVSVNEVFAQDFGLRPDELIGKSDHDLHPKSLADKYREDDLRVLASRKAETIEELNMVGSDTRYVEVVKAPVTDDKGEVAGIVGVFTDITERKRAEKKLQQLASYDELTGVRNRREMQRILREQISRYKRYRRSASLILLDIDHFKRVNDLHGHQVGDQVLHWLGDLLRANVRDMDIAVRYGGEEFAIILPDTTEDEAFSAAERIRESIECQPFISIPPSGEKPLELHITASMGVAAVTDGDTTGEALISKADQALYIAKKLGRNCVVQFTASRDSGDSIPSKAGKSMVTVTL